MGILSKMKNGEVVLFHRGDSPEIYCRVRSPEGKWVARSTRKRSEEAARAVALEIHMEVLLRHKHGLTSKTTTFAHACDLYEKTLREEVELGRRNPRHLKDYLPVVGRYLRPYFGRRKIDEITNRDLLDYQTWRAAYWTKGTGAKKRFIEYKRNGKGFHPLSSIIAPDGPTQ